MAHEITNKDNLILYKNPAWHDLGEIVHDKMDAQTAFDKSGLNWEVKFGDEEISMIDGKEYRQSKYKTLWRIDGENSSPMGNFTDAYKPIQNKQLFELGQEIINLASSGEGDPMFMESAGSIQEGRKVWLLLNQECRQINDNDVVHKYVAIANSHDGKLMLGVKPTSIRVVCNNTLSQAFGDCSGSYISIAHKGCVVSKLEAAKYVLKQYFDISAKFDENVRRLMGKKISQADAKNLIKEEWNRIFPGKKKESFYEDYLIKSVNTYEREIEELKYKDLNLWLVANSVTNVFQNEIAGKGKKKENVENHVYSKLLCGSKLFQADKTFYNALKKVA